MKQVSKTIPYVIWEHKADIARYVQYLLSFTYVF